MIKLLKNAQVYSPAPLGKKDVLVIGDKVARIDDSIQGYDGLPEVEVIDLKGKKLLPGYIDIHIHITGGGGEQGFTSRVPESQLSVIVGSGITTVLGLLGTDGTSRSLENLLGKVTALETEGLSAYMLTGSYQYPTVTLTGSVLRDIMLTDKIIGAKLAMSDHRSSTITVDELIRLASDVNMGGMLSGKAGLLTIHTGVRKGMLDPIFRALEQSDVPIETFLPTHVGRNYQLLDQAIKLAKMGGNFDLTAHGSLKEDGESAADMAAYCIRQGVDLDRMSMSSDGNGSQPRFDETGRCIGLTYVSPAVLLWELRRGVQQLDIPLEQMLRLFTASPALRLGKEGVKGCVRPGADADLIALSADLQLTHVLAKGKLAMEQGRLMIKGTFEE